ncbi:MAG TPA: hypothetical protein VEI46_11470 [Thermodesulfovibrionales bacterium]|nr:hypothetical protein [Thermodesulfovibrionales bacterium]
MELNTMSYSKCICRKCGTQYATMLNNDAELQNEPCPKCGEKELRFSGPLGLNELRSTFGGGGG